MSPQDPERRLSGNPGTVLRKLEILRPEYRMQLHSGAEHLGKVINSGIIEHGCR
jgi:hypothetical protein